MGEKAQGRFATMSTVHNDTIEQLVGFGLIVLFGVALVVWPPFAELAGRFAFPYLRDFPLL